MESNKRSLSSDEKGAAPSPEEFKMANQLKEISIEEEEANDLNFEKVIGIELVFDVLEKMLDYDDLKALRRVSKTCEEVVLKHKFICKTQFMVCNEALIVRGKRFDSRVLEHMRFEPKHLKIEQVLGSFEEVPHGSLIRSVQRFKNLSSIKIIFFVGWPEGTDFFWRILQEVIACNRLTLQEIMVETTVYQVFDRLNMAELTFPKLECLEISFGERATQSLIQFLSSHFSQLKYLSLRFDGTFPRHFPIQLLRLLENATSNKLSNLCISYPRAHYLRVTAEWHNEPRILLNLRHLSSLREFVMQFGYMVGVGIDIHDLPPSLEKIVVSPSYQSRNRLFPGGNIDEVRKILPNLRHLELKHYRPFGPHEYRDFTYTSKP